MNPPQLPRAIVRVPLHFVESLARSDFSADYICVPKAIGLPETARCISAHYEPERMGFILIFEDESFPPSSPGCLLFEIKIEWSVIELEKKKE